MATHVKSNCAKPGIGKIARNSLPCSPGLPTSMSEQDRHRVRRAGDLGGEVDAAGSLDAGWYCGHSNSVYCKVPYSKYLYSRFGEAMTGSW
jgi:hypothetical protein